MKKKYKSGKVKRHKFRKQLGLKQGFGKSWSGRAIAFRCEFSWVNIEGDESNFTNRWVECRKFEGKEKRFLKAHFAQVEEEWNPGETAESKFTAIWCALDLCDNIDKAQYNQVFIFPADKVKSEKIKYPLYQIKYTENLKNNLIDIENKLKIILRNSVYEIPHF